MASINLAYRLLVGITSIVSLMLVSAGPGAQAAEPSLGPALNMNPMSFVPNRSVIQLLAQVVRTDFVTADQSGEVYQVGTLSLKVIDVLSPGLLGTGPNLQVPYHYSPKGRFSKRNLDGWNELDLAPGKYLLLAVSSPDGGKSWQAVGGKSVASPQDPDVDADRQAAAIEAAPNALQKQELLQRALASGNASLLGFAVDALAHRKILNSTAAAKLLADALASTSLPVRQKSYVGYGMADWFRPDPLADRTGATILLAALASKIVQAGTPAERSEYAGYLAECVPARPETPAAAAFEAQVIAAVRTPGAGAATAALHAVATDSSLGKPFREKIEMLAQQWKKASARPQAP